MQHLHFATRTGNIILICLLRTSLWPSTTDLVMFVCLLSSSRHSRDQFMTSPVQISITIYFIHSPAGISLVAKRLNNRIDDRRPHVADEIRMENTPHIQLQPARTSIQTYRYAGFIYIHCTTLFDALLKGLKLILPSSAGRELVIFSGLAFNHHFGVPVPSHVAIQLNVLPNRVQPVLLTHSHIFSCCQPSKILSPFACTCTQLTRFSQQGTLSKLIQNRIPTATTSNTAQNTRKLKPNDNLNRPPHCASSTLAKIECRMCQTTWSRSNRTTGSAKTREQTELHTARCWRWLLASSSSQDRLPSQPHRLLLSQFIWKPCSLLILSSCLIS